MGRIGTVPRVVYTVMTAYRRQSLSTATTRIFKSGNSLAVRIPKDMQPAAMPDEAQIEWRNGVWTIKPINKRSLAGLMDVFGAFPADFMAGGRAPREQKPRDWLGLKQPTGSPSKARAQKK
jgi:antitoxin VapB